MSWTTVNDLLDRLHEQLADSQQVFFQPAEELAALNEGMMQLFQIIDSQRAGYYFETTPETITLVPGTKFYPLINDFYSVEEILPQADAERFRTFIRKPRHEEQFRDAFAAATSDDNYGDVDTFYFDVVGDSTLIIVPPTNTSFAVDVYTVREPTMMVAGTGTPPVKLGYRPLIVQYAARKLKSKEENSEYKSDEQLYQFMVTNLEKSATPRAETNRGTVEDFNP